MKKRSASQIKYIALAIALIWSSATTAAPLTYAGGKISLDAEYSLNGGATIDGMSTGSVTLASLNDSNWWGTSHEGADLFLSDNAGPSGVFFHTYGFTGSSTYFGARVSGNGDFSAKTRSSYSDTITNTSAAEQTFNFTFSVDWGQISIDGVGDALAEMLLRVKVNDTDVARDKTTITQVSGVTSCNTDDVGGALSSYLGCSSTNASSATGLQNTYTVNLGTFAAGESFDLDYDIISTVRGDFATTTECTGPTGGPAGRPLDVAQVMAMAVNNGDNGAEVGEPVYCEYTGGAGAQSGDPFDPFWFENSFRVTTSSVPEPGSLALLGLGIAGLVSLKRRHSKNDT